MKEERKQGSTYLPLSLLLCLHLTLQFLDSVGVLAHLLTLSVRGQTRIGTECLLGAMPVFA